MITLDQYCADPSTGEDRRKLYPNSWNSEIEANSLKLLDILNKFLKDLNINDVKITSGFRPSEVNGKLTNAAKKSYHMIGMACDIKDNNSQDLAKLISSKPELLKSYGLWLEDPSATHYWVHLDIGNRQDRPSRIFKV